MAGKVPKFGAWEGGENFTAHFDIARKTKQNGSMIKNPNVPEKAGGSTTPEPETKVKPAPQETRPKVPPFGGWEDQSGGEVGYTMYFDKARENKGMPPNLEELFREPQLNRDTGPPPSPAPTKDPRVKVLGPTNKATPQQQESIGSTVDSVPHRRQHGVAQIPKIGCVRGVIIDEKALASNSERSFHPPQQIKKIPQPEKVATIPPFAVWNDDPSKTAGFSGTFARLKEEKLTPLHRNASSSHNNQPQSKEEPKKGFFNSFFG